MKDAVHSNRLLHRFFLHVQVYVDLQVIEPAWDLDPAAVHTSIALLSVKNSQRHIPVCHTAQQLEPGGLSQTHLPILG